jgi:sugar lactone lactonase YvrE
MHRIFLVLVFLPFAVSAQTLTNIESVEYDPINQRFLVSNGNRVIEVDGDGDPVGYFGTAPRSDYGMEVMNGRLFTIVGSSVRAYDLTSALQVMSVTVTDAQFLNGLASDGVSRLWVTDFGAKKIHEIDVTSIDSPVVTEVVSNTVQTPNGITYDGANERLVFVTWGSSARIKAIALSDYAMTELTQTSLTNIDGIDHDEDGNFFISSWLPTPRITRYSSEFSVSEQITAPGLSSPADICYAVENDTLAIPNSGLNTVTYVGFSPAAGVNESAAGEMGLNCFPNPITDQSVLTFRLFESGHTVIELMDLTGKVIHTILSENLPATEHKVLLTGVEFASGAYICSVRQGERQSSLVIRK